MIEKISEKVYKYDIPLKGGEEQWFLFVSDVHYDSKGCNRDLLKRHLREAKDKDARIMMYGDIFDCMGGKYDKRTSKEDIRPEYNNGNYFDSIVSDAAAFFEPYKHNIDFVSLGNHEDSIRKIHEISLIDNFVYRLGTTTVSAPYSGWVKFQVAKQLTSKTNGISTKVMYYTHGNGGNSPVTKGIIGTNRRQVMIQADFFLSGHLHSELEVPLTRVRLNEANNEVIEKIKHWQLGTYANTWGSSYSDKKGHAPDAQGGRWLKIRLKSNEVYYESMLAE